MNINLTNKEQKSILINSVRETAASVVRKYFDGTLNRGDNQYLGESLTGRIFETSVQISNSNGDFVALTR